METKNGFENQVMADIRQYVDLWGKYPGLGEVREWMVEIYELKISQEVATRIAGLLLKRIKEEQRRHHQVLKPREFYKVEEYQPVMRLRTAEISIGG